MFYIAEVLSINVTFFFQMMGLFGQGKKPDTKEAVRELQRKMRVELRQLDRQIHAIEREEMKVDTFQGSRRVYTSKD